VTRLLLPSAALALAVLGGSAAPVSASPQVQVVTDVHGVGLGSAAVRCLPAGRAVAVLTVRTGSRRSTSWVAKVGGPVAAHGTNRPEPAFATSEFVRQPVAAAVLAELGVLVLVDPLRLRQQLGDLRGQDLLLVGHPGG